MKNYAFKALLFGLALLGLGTTVYHRPGLQEPAVTNETKALEVVSVLSTETGYELLLRNASAKSINGYSVVLKNGASVTVDLTVGERAIASGDQFTARLPPSAKTMEPTIRYIIFDDGTGDGDIAGIAELLARRSGRQDQLERIVPLLRAAAASADIEQLKTQLQALPEDTADKSFYRAQGMRDAKEDALLATAKLNKGNVPAALSKLVEESNRQILRLQKRATP